MAEPTLEGLNGGETEIPPAFSDAAGASGAPTAVLLETPSPAPPGTEDGAAPKAPPKEKKKTSNGARKRRKRIIKWGIAAAVLLAAAFGLYKFLAPKEEEGQVVTDTVQYGSIVSTVEGMGLSRPKESASITVTTAGTVTDVLVQPGDYVTVGTPLYTIDSEPAKTAVETAEKDVRGFEKQLAALYKDIAGLNLSAPYAGKLLDIRKFQTGDTISKGETVAKLVDDTRFTITQYYSYAYQYDLYVGQSVSVSVPSMMTQVSGTISAIHMVERVSAEGSKLFSVDITVNNPGTLTNGMAASASVALDTGETVMPYENGSLAYSRETEIKSTVNGTVEWTGLIDYLSVSAGQQLLRISGDDSENEIFSLEQSLKTARETLETAQKNLDNMNAVAPINGTVLAVGITPGAEITAGTATISIADTTVMLIDANVDERNISYIQPGMMVNLDQWGTMFTGVVDSVSLSGKVENGVSTFPAVISVDNPDGMMMTGSSVTYSLVASQNDNCLILPIQCVKYVQLDDGSTGTVVFVKGERPDSAIDLSFPVEGVPEGFWAVPVETGIADTYNVEIKSGVEEGVEVFTAVQTMNAWM